MMIIRLVVVAILIYLIVELFRSGGSYSAGSGCRFFRRKPDLKCAYCRHCREIADDGVMCSYRGKQTFKTIVHIQNCTDYERDS